jgi:UDP-N-acetylmuramyl pentapeptide phosphotransferase/UDP-N-acetylglucosamine-1-phosphate transferase
MIAVLCSLVIAFVTTYVSVPVIILIADKKKLYDIPDSRKVHKKPIASLGGVGIFGGFALACLLCVPFSQAAAFTAYLGAALILFFLGLKDDILVISPLKKSIGQLLAALLVIIKGDLYLTSLHGFLGVYEIPHLLGIALTLFALIVIINAFNLIDGLDGLAGTLGLSTSAIFGFFFLDNHIYSYAVLSFALSGSLVAFLWFNYNPARIFMGDTGSMLIGLVNAILALKLIQIEPSAPVFSSDASPAIAFSILMVPLLDTLRVFTIRLWQKRSPFSPDRNHIHHILLDKGCSHNKVAFTLLAINLAAVVLVYLGSSLGTTWLITLMGGSYFIIIKIIGLIRSTSNKSTALNQKAPVKVGALHTFREVEWSK